MSCTNYDGNGNIQVYTFTITTIGMCPDCMCPYCDRIIHRCTDYTEGWEWACKTQKDFWECGNIQANIDVDWEYIPVDEWENSKEESYEV